MSRLGELRKEHFDPFEHNNDEEDSFFIQESSSFLSFDIFLPKAERKYAFDVRYDDKVIEKAHVLYNNNVFLVYAETDNDVSSAYFGQEIRELLKKHLKSQYWDAEIIPPCPLHPEIYVNIVLSDALFNVEVDENDDVIISLPI